MNGNSSQLALEFPEPTADSVPEEEWIARAVERTGHYLYLARDRWPQSDLRHPTLSFGLRGLTAGEACSSDWTLRYNRLLLARNGERFLSEIVPHEVAHLVVAAVWPGRRSPHGAEWKEVMAFFGTAANRCHRFDTVPARRVRRFAYRCSCTIPHLLTKRAHLRIRRGTAEYSCRECRDVLTRVEA